ncbi:hypothetical protein EJ419_03675 [Alloscardovia theropitheci]|uniref:Uncharacterized protein n=1 Tax=Alloscardovia theropitheci TaxID=2496842 RepID=A0A4R0QZP8_9BIFI|nr:DUF6541 family protein [Alloscardovia theropitheci]TCD54156.1 hypothetical protein EJ419_03675 [Alloscardovia theropitheci]
MWIQFLMSVAITLILVYLPGTLIMRSLKVSWLFAIVLAPAVSVAAYVALGIILSALHIRGNWATIALPIILLSILVFAVALHIARSKSTGIDGKECNQVGSLLAKGNYKVALLYLAFAVVVSVLLFLKNLDTAASYMQLYDNAWHLGIIRDFLAHGDFSPMHSGSIIATQGSAFYPTGYHTIVALVSSVSHISITVASNAVVFVEIVVILPLSVYLLFSIVFKNNPLLMYVGAVVPLMFQTFPWLFITFGPLWSNLLATSVAPAIFAVLIILFDARTSLYERIVAGIYSLFAFIFAAVTQPNTIFTLAVLIVPFVFSQISAYCVPISDKRTRRIVVNSIYAGFVVFIAAAWLFLYHASFMQRTVTWNWDKIGNLYQVARDVYLLGFSAAEGQPILAVLVAVGIIVTFIRRRYLWMTLSYTIFCVFYMASAGTEGRIKHLLTGFWYTDYHRLASSAVLVALPLAALGLACVVSIVVSGYKLIDTKHNEVNERVLAVVVVLVLVVSVFMPYTPRDTAKESYNAFGAVARDINYWNASNQPKSYTAAESNFVKAIQREIPADAVVLNNPYDGSAYAWGEDGLNVFYKAWQGNWMGKPTDDSREIMSHLNDIATNEHVCAAVNNIKAQYVIQLDQKDYWEVEGNTDRLQSIYAGYSSSEWVGINSITNQTPGFTLVTERDGMKLYKINSCS